MAIKEIRREWSACQLGYVCEFMLHTEKDVQDLPICCVGSVAHVSETNTDYVCTGKRWVLRAEEVVILPETAMVWDGGSGNFFLTEPLSAPLTLGMDCNVTYNGVAYKCTTKEVPFNGETVTALGNIGSWLGEEGTGEPFAFILTPDSLAEILPGIYAQVYPVYDVETVTISITAKTELVNESENAGGGAGAGSGGGGLGSFYIDVDALANLSGYAYRDAALTDMLTYEQGCNAMRDGGIIRFASSAMPDMLEGYIFPAMLQMDTDARKISVLVNMGGGVGMVDILFSDSVE